MTIADRYDIEKLKKFSKRLQGYADSSNVAGFTSPEVDESARILPELIEAMNFMQTGPARKKIRLGNNDTFYGANETDPAELRRCLKFTHYQRMDLEEMLQYLFDKHKTKEGVTPEEWEWVRLLMVDCDTFHLRFSKTKECGGFAPEPMFDVDI